MKIFLFSSSEIKHVSLWMLTSHGLKGTLLKYMNKFNLLKHEFIFSPQLLLKIPMFELYSRFLFHRTRVFKAYS